MTWPLDTTLVGLAQDQQVAHPGGEIEFSGPVGYPFTVPDNPQANLLMIGMGTGVAGIDNFFTQGTLENTGLGTDLAIQGDAMFVLNNGSRTVYSRAGDFQLDANGRLISPSSGFVVQGINAFTLGMRETNPKAQVKVVWLNTWFDPAREREAALTLINLGADVLTNHSGSPAVPQAAQEFRDAAGAAVAGREHGERRHEQQARSLRPRRRGRAHRHPA